MGRIYYSVYISGPDSYAKFLASTKVPQTVQDAFERYVKQKNINFSSSPGTYGVYNELPNGWNVKYVSSGNQTHGKTGGTSTDVFGVKVLLTDLNEFNYFKDRTLPRIQSLLSQQDKTTIGQKMEKCFACPKCNQKTDDLQSQFSCSYFFDSF